MLGITNPHIHELPEYLGLTINNKVIYVFGFLKKFLYIQLSAKC